MYFINANIITIVQGKQLFEHDPQAMDADLDKYIRLG